MVRPARFIPENKNGVLRKWRGSFWERRYDGIVVSDEPEAQWRRLKYLSHSVKEGLCESPVEWPGVHAARALTHDEPLEGYWFNRSKEWAAQNDRDIASLSRLQDRDSPCGRRR